jgi:hypothetical protein
MRAARKEYKNRTAKTGHSGTGQPGQNNKNTRTTSTRQLGYYNRILKILGIRLSGIGLV